MLAGSGDVKASGNRAAQVEWRVPLHSGLGLAKIGPGKQSQREVDGRRIQSIERVRQIEAQVFPGLEFSGFGNKSLCQVLPPPPSALLVGLGQRRAGDGFAEAQVVKSFRAGMQTRLDVAQALPPSQL